MLVLIQFFEVETFMINHIYLWRNWGSATSSNLPKLMQLVIESEFKPGASNPKLLTSFLTLSQRSPGFQTPEGGQVEPGPNVFRRWRPRANQWSKDNKAWRWGEMVTVATRDTARTSDLSLSLFVGPKAKLSGFGALSPPSLPTPFLAALPHIPPTTLSMRTPTDTLQQLHIAPDTTPSLHRQLEREWHVIL